MWEILLLFIRVRETQKTPDDTSDSDRQVTWIKVYRHTSFMMSFHRCHIHMLLMLECGSNMDGCSHILTWFSGLKQHICLQYLSDKVAQRKQCNDIQSMTLVKVSYHQPSVHHVLASCDAIPAPLIWLIVLTVSHTLHIIRGKLFTTEESPAGGHWSFDWSDTPQEAKCLSFFCV